MVTNSLFNSVSITATFGILKLKQRSEYQLGTFGDEKGNLRT